jgi:hypothetical protein
VTIYVDTLQHWGLQYPAKSVQGLSIPRKPDTELHPDAPESPSRTHTHLVDFGQSLKFRVTKGQTLPGQRRPRGLLKFKAIVNQAWLQK